MEETANDEMCVDATVPVQEYDYDYRPICSMLLTHWINHHYSSHLESMTTEILRCCSCAICSGNSQGPPTKF